MGLQGALKHEDVKFVTHSDVALRVMQHDQAVGLGHGAQHTRALAAGGLDLQAPSGAVETQPRWYSVRPAFLRIASMLWALSSGGGAALAPIICSRAGRTKARKVTITATGLPGRPNRMAPFCYGFDSCLLAFC
jgi:hypothetical protein